jgi:hypothetical protein
MLKEYVNVKIRMLIITILMCRGASGVMLKNAVKNSFDGFTLVISLQDWSNLDGHI